MNKAPKSATKETPLKKAKTVRAQTVQPPSQAPNNGAKSKLAPAAATGRPTFGLSKKHGITVALTKPATERSLTTNGVANSTRDRATAELLAYLEKGERSKKKAKLPYKLGIDINRSDGFHTSSFQYNQFGLIGPATAPTAVTGTARREPVTKGTKKKADAIKLRAQTPANIRALGSKSEILNQNQINITPPNSLESVEDTSASAESKGLTVVRSVPSYDNLLAQVRKKIGADAGTKKPKSILQDTETKTVMPVRALTKTSSLQLMVPEHLKALKAKLDIHKNPTKTKMTLNNIIGQAGISALAPPSEAKKLFENSAAKAIRSAIFELTNKESESDKVRKSLSIENTSSAEIKKDALKVKKTGIKGKLKKSTKSKSKTITQTPSKEQFFEYQNKKVDEQFTHVYERQERLETEIRRLIDALEIEQAIRGTASHGLTPAPCCCSAEIRGKLKSLLQKQKQLIRLQIDLRKRYGAGPANWENQTDPDMPILNGYNMPYERFAAFAREQNGKMIYYCDNCNASSDTELLFRLHLESPQHVVKAYKDIHNDLPVFQCEGCDLDLKGTTKYMNHVTSDNVHLQKILNPSSGAKRVKSSHSQQALIQESFLDQ